MTSVGSSDFDELCDEDTSHSRAGSVDLQEQIQLAQPDDDAVLADVQLVLHQHNKDTNGMCGVVN